MNAIVFNVNKRIPDVLLQSFSDTNVGTIICDNSANVHICNDKEMFIDLQPPSANSVVATIGGQNNSPQGKGTVRQSWKDNEGQTHSFHIRDVYYFPGSPINILGITTFAMPLYDEETTSVNTRWKTSKLYWKGGFSQTLHHPLSQLPEMALVASSDNNAFSSYVLRNSESFNDFIQFRHLSCFSCSNVVSEPVPITQSQPESQVEDITTSEFEIGERLFYSDEGHTSMVRVKDIQSANSNNPKFLVELPSKECISVDSLSLRCPQQPDIASVPISAKDYSNEATHLSSEDCNAIEHPTILSPEQQELMS